MKAIEVIQSRTVSDFLLLFHCFGKQRRQQYRYDTVYYAAVTQYTDLYKNAVYLHGHVFL